jgi:hypothetical protein
MKWQRFSLRITGAVLLVVAIASGCKKEAAVAPLPPLPAVVSFGGHIQPFFSSTCAVSGCHTGSSPAAGLNLTASVAYNDLFLKHEIDTLSPTSSNLYIFMNSNMPPSGKVPYDLALVLKWIQQGAKNN